MGDVLSPKARLDLHLHTSRSDGLLTPREVLGRAVARRLHVLAITDHDLVPALPAGVVRSGGHTLHLVHGAEVSCRHNETEIHVLVYFPGQMPERFQDFLRDRTRWRAQRFDEARVRLGVEDAVAPAPQEAWDGRLALTRHHLARALVQAGTVGSVDQAFKGPLARRHGAVDLVDLTSAELLARVQEAGGFSSWAHPPLDVAKAWTPELAALGLDALEAKRPGIGRASRNALVRLALKHKLAITGGSDWHGWVGGNPGHFSVYLREVRPFAKAVGLPLA